MAGPGRPVFGQRSIQQRAQQQLRQPPSAPAGGRPATSQQTLAATPPRPAALATPAAVETAAAPARAAGPAVIASADSAPLSVVARPAVAAVATAEAAVASRGATPEAVVQGRVATVEATSVAAPAEVALSDLPLPDILTELTRLFASPVEIDPDPEDAVVVAEFAEEEPSVPISSTDDHLDLSQHPQGEEGGAASSATPLAVQVTVGEVDIPSRAPPADTVVPKPILADKFAPILVFTGTTSEPDLQPNANAVVVTNFDNQFVRFKNIDTANALQTALRAVQWEDGTTVLVGSSALLATMHIDSPLVVARHAYLVQHRGNIYIVPIDSAGVSVNGSAVRSPTLLHPDNIVELSRETSSEIAQEGRFIFTWLDPRQAATAGGNEGSAGQPQREAAQAIAGPSDEILANPLLGAELAGPDTGTFSPTAVLLQRIDDNHWGAISVSHFGKIPNCLQHFALPPGAVALVGSSDDATILHRGLASRHFVLRVDRDGVALYPMDGNPVYVNNTEVGQRVVLQDGDMVKAGDQSMTWETPNTVERPSAVPDASAPAAVDEPAPAAPVAAAPAPAVAPVATAASVTAAAKPTPPMTPYAVMNNIVWVKPVTRYMDAAIIANGAEGTIRLPGRLGFTFRATPQHPRNNGGIAAVVLRDSDASTPPMIVTMTAAYLSDATEAQQAYAAEVLQGLVDQLKARHGDEPTSRKQLALDNVHSTLKDLLSEWSEKLSDSDLNLQITVEQGEGTAAFSVGRSQIRTHAFGNISTRRSLRHLVRPERVAEATLPTNLGEAAMIVSAGVFLNTTSEAILQALPIGRGASTRAAAIAEWVLGVVAPIAKAMGSTKLPQRRPVTHANIAGWAYRADPTMTAARFAEQMDRIYRDPSGQKKPEVAEVAPKKIRFFPVDGTKKNPPVQK
ncbi:MAG: hypothetical protein HYV02_08650 [Deltaproteobacteria bacterium]|nr:hypothetical protein [Deltaproteobacteria bacterium]